MPNYDEKQTTILVTGGAGFIGSNFIIYMLSKYSEYNIINLDALTYAGNLENLKEVESNPNYLFINGNICDSEAINRLFTEYKPKYVVNFAAESHVDRSITDPQIFIKTNVLGTQVLLDTCRIFWSKNRSLESNKYIQISTDEVYGSLGPTGYFTEETPLAPSSPYSASKAAADMLVSAYYKTYGLNVNITRCSNNYGPRQHPEKLIPLMILNTLENKDLSVYGDGMNIRDWLYVEDHCRAIDLVLHKGKMGEIYNVGGNTEKKNIEIIKEILKKLGGEEDSIKFIKDRLGHDKRYAINASKIKEELGWMPLITLDKGMDITIKWYLANNEHLLSNIKLKLKQCIC